MHKKRIGKRNYFYTTFRNKDKVKRIYLGKDYKLAKLKENKLLKTNQQQENWISSNKFLVVLTVILFLALIYSIFLSPAHIGYFIYGENNSNDNLIIPQIITKAGHYNLTDNGNKIFDLIYEDGKRKVEINGIKTKKDINLIIDRVPGEKVDYIKADPESIEFATITLTHDVDFLPKGGITSAPRVLMCDNFDEINNNCTTNWINTGIIPKDINDNFVFNVTHFTVYTIGTGMNYNNLQNCLFYVNGTSDSCIITQSNYDETIGSRFWHYSMMNHYNRTGMIVGYDFEDGNGTLISDKSGLGNNGMSYLNATFVKSFAENFGYYINRQKGSGINITYNDGLNATKEITISTFANLTHVGINNNIYVSGTGNILRTTTTNVLACLFVNYTGSTITCTGTASIQRNKYTHLACTYNNSDIFLYVNGMLDKQCYLGGDLKGLSSIPQRIGSNGQDLNIMNGTLDNFAVWNRSLSADEIKNISYGGLYQYESVYNLTNGTSFIEIDTLQENITIDFNGSHIQGYTQGSGIFTDSATRNITIKNLYINGFSRNLELNGYNNTFDNITSDNAIEKNFMIGNLAGTENTTIINSNSINSRGAGIYISGGNNIYLSNINSSDNFLSCLASGAIAGIDIRNSYFSNTTSGTGVSLFGTNHTFVNNTVTKFIIDEQIALQIANSPANILISNNTIKHNSINTWFIDLTNSRVINNIFDSNYDINVLGAGIGANVVVDGDMNNNFINNTFNNSYDYGIFATITFASVNPSNLNNTLKGNIFNNVTNIGVDLNLASPAQTINTILYLNHFYDGISDLGDNTTYCYNNEGNFYRDTITTINETDCGRMNITNPDGYNIISYNPYKINWTKQSSVRTINYSIYYSNNTGVNYYYINSTTNLEYDWNISGFPYSPNYTIKIIPFDGNYNGTNDNSTWNFTIQNFAPIIPILISPDNESSTITRKPNFTWQESIDTNGEIVYYDILIDDNPEFTSPIRSDNQTTTSFVPLTNLNVDTNYYWKVRANDQLSNGLSAFSTVRMVTINSYVSISINGTANINFGNKIPKDIDNTTDDVPPSLLIQNDGNCFVNITVNATKNLWDTQGLNTQYFRYKSGINESGSFSVSQNSWTNMLSTAALFVDMLNYVNETDNARYDTLIEVPTDEGPGDKGVGILFTASLGDHAS